MMIAGYYYSKGNLLLLLVAVLLAFIGLWPITIIMFLIISLSVRVTTAKLKKQGESKL